MPDDDYEPDEIESGVLKELRQKAKAHDEAVSKVKDLETQVAILGAGLHDISPTRQKALLAAHEGDLTAEAIRKTAAELGFVSEQASEEPTVPSDEQAAHQRAQEVTGAATPAEGHVETLDDRIAKAQSAAELDMILKAAGHLGPAN